MKSGYKGNSVILFIGAIFFFIGLVTAVIIGGFIKSWIDFQDVSEPVSAVITDIERVRSGDDTTHYVYIAYEYGGNTYSDTLGYYSSGMHRGQHVDIRVDRNDPSVFKSSPLLISGFMSIFILIFGGIGAGFLIHELRAYLITKKLVERDQYVICDRWEEAMSDYRVNHVRYRCIRAFYETGGRTYEFKSQPYSPERCPLLPGESVVVYVDIEADPGRYYVDLKNAASATDGFM